MWIVESRRIALKGISFYLHIITIKHTVLASTNIIAIIEDTDNFI